MNAIRTSIISGFSGALLCGSLASLMSFQHVTSRQSVSGLTGEQLAILDFMSLEQLDDGQGGFVETIRITGANLQLVNGMGASWDQNGTGNLIVGYNELGNALGDDRTGSHCIVTGARNSFSSSGCFVGGTSNQVSADWGAILAGSGNHVTAIAGAVLGGTGGQATGDYSVVGGGFANTASGNWSAATGGQQNEASGLSSAVSGGILNQSTSDYDSVSGGGNNVASGGASSVSGGAQNMATGGASAVSGGLARSAVGERDWVAGTLFEDN